jgi:SAM-dependent methyltransferase
VPLRRESWDQRWADDDYQPPFELRGSDLSVRRAVDDGWFSPAMRALDIGCGGGYNAAWLAEQGLESVGIDFSREAVERAREAFKGKPRLTFEVVDVVEPGSYAETFDALVDRGCLHGIDRGGRGAYARNLKLWSRPGGHFLLIVRNKERSDAQVVARATGILRSGFVKHSHRSVDLAGPYTNDPLPAVAMRFVRAS